MVSLFNKLIHTRAHICENHTLPPPPLSLSHTHRHTLTPVRVLSLSLSLSLSLYLSPPPPLSLSLSLSCSRSDSPQSCVADMHICQQTNKNKVLICWTLTKPLRLGRKKRARTLTPGHKLKRGEKQNTTDQIGSDILQTLDSREHNEHTKKHSKKLMKS